jgi:hypothetical protein
MLATYELQVAFAQLKDLEVSRSGVGEEVGYGSASVISTSSFTLTALKDLGTHMMRVSMEL